MVTRYHRAYREWANELQFYRDEIRIFQKELNLIVERHPSLLSIIEHVDEYRHILEKKNNKIDVLQDRIRAKEKLLVIRAEPSSADFEEIENKHKTFVTKMEALKQNFKRFVAKNMH